MQALHYRLISSVLALVVHQGQKILVTLPSGAIVEVDDPSPGKNGLIAIISENRKLMMLGADLQDCGEWVKTEDRSPRRA
jgi:hypothetical protein